MSTTVAKKLYRALVDDDPDNYDWFNDAVALSSSQRRPLDRIIWESVREMLALFNVQLPPSQKM